jgi:hypothetical protein
VTKGGIQLPEESQLAFHYGYAALCGPEVKTVKPGDFVIFEPAHAKEVTFDNLNKTWFTVIVELGVFLACNRAAADYLNMEIPQMDLSDVLSRTKANAVALT